MNRILVWSARHPRAGLCLAVGGALLLGSGGLRLRLDTSKEALFADRTGEFERYEEFSANFGSDERIVIVAAGPRLFEAPALEWLRTFDTDLAARDEIRSVESIFRLERTVRRGNWLLPVPLIDKLPQSDDESIALRETVLSDRRAAAGLVSSDGGAMNFLVGLEIARSDNESLIASAVADFCEEAAAFAPADLELFAVGAPLILAETRTAMRRDRITLFALTVAVLLGATLLLFRGWTAAIPPTTCAILGTSATLGFIGWMAYPFTIALFPAVILVAVISTSESIYLVAAFREKSLTGLSRSAAAESLGPALGRTILLASTTSSAGFATVALTANVGLQQFAIAGAVGSLLNLLVTALATPALLALMPLPPRAHLAPRTVLRKLRASLVRLPEPARRRLGFVCAAVLVGVGAGVFRIEISTSFLEYLPRDNPLVERVNRFRELFGGLSHDSVVVETHVSGGALRPESLDELERFRDYLATRVDAVEGLPDLFAEAERHLGEINIAGVLHEAIPGELLRKFIDHDGSRTRFHVRSHAPRSQDMLELERFVQAYPTDGFPEGTEISLMGTWPMASRLSDRIVRDLLSSLALLAFVTAALLGAALRSTKLGLIALVPNLLPLLATLGAMGWLGIPLGFGVFAVGIVAFAVAANDTVHFLVTRHRRSQRYSDSARASRATLREVFLPVVTTSLILVAGFSALTASSLGNIRETGFLLAFSALAAMAADLFVTPSLAGLGAFASRRKIQEITTSENSEQGQV